MEDSDILYFCLSKFDYMITMIHATGMILFLLFAVFQMFKNRRNSGYVDVRATAMPRLFYALSAMFCCSMVCRNPDSSRLLYDSMIAVTSVTPLVTSIRPAGRLPLCCFNIPIIIPIMTACYLLSAFSVVKLPGTSSFMALSVLVAIFSSGSFVWMIWRKLRDVKSVMKSGNSWAFVNLCVDFIYVLFPIMAISMLYLVQIIFPTVFRYVLPVSVMLIILEVIALAVRVSYDSAFVILHDHERVIVESMKIAQMDMSSSSDPKGDRMYKELYDRVVLYFDLSKPYLDGNLTINDVVKEVYSNKVYISKAIFHYTGRNFRQFVNYYRVVYSMDLFRANLEFKVAELAEKSGFNTMVSYTMAFRLFMNETPSEWCRRERAKILKKKK